MSVPIVHYPSSMTMHRIATCLFLCAIPLPAQELGDRDFFPEDYRAEVFVDFGALKDNGIWAGFERSLLASAFVFFDEHFGFAMADLDEMRFYPEVRLGDEETGQLMVFRGNEQVGLPPMGLQGRPHEIVKVGAHEVMHDTTEGDYYFSPRPGLVLFGGEQVVLPVLRGERKGGVPSPELMSMVSGRGNLAYAVVPIPKEALDEPGFPGLPKDWYAAEDPPVLFAFRLRQVGDEESGYRITAQVTVRCENGSEGPARLKSLAEQGLRWLTEHPRLGAMKRYWTAVEIATEGRDVVGRLDLGTPRQAAGVLPMMIAPMMLVGTTVPPDAAPAQPAGPKKDAGKGR